MHVHRMDIKFAMVWIMIMVAAKSDAAYCDSREWACCGTPDEPCSYDGPPRVIIVVCNGGHTTVAPIAVADGGIAWIEGLIPPFIYAHNCGTGRGFTLYNFTLSPIPGHDDDVCQPSADLSSTGRNLLWGQFPGGNARLTWIAYNDSEQPTVIGNGAISFQILGRNANRTTIIHNLESWYGNNRGLDYFPYIAGAESNFSHFLPNGHIKIHRDKNGTRGYGLCQLTVPKPSCMAIWNPVTNGRIGASLLHAKVDEARSFMQKQRQQAREDNGTNVPVPDRREGNCLFSDWTKLTIEDAVAIKMYNSATHNYCSWTRRNDSEGIKGEWFFHPLNEANPPFNYVNRVCELMPV